MDSSFLVLSVTLGLLFGSFLTWVSSFVTKRDRARENKMLERLLNELEHSERLSPSIQFENNSVTRELTARLLAEQNRPIVVNVSTAPTVGHDPVVGLGQEHGKVIGELAHGLNTPLSQIDAAAISVLRSLHMQGAASDESPDIKSLERIQASVSLCNLILAAYSEAASKSAATVSPESLSRAVLESAQVFGAAPGKVKVRLPERVQGYSNTFVLAVLFPLIENAFDAVPEGQDITVFMEENDDELIFIVRNVISQPEFGTEAYEPGYTSKEKHTGLGLASVRRLLATRSGRLSHEFEDGYVKFLASLPKVLE